MHRPIVLRRTAAATRGGMRGMRGPTGIIPRPHRVGHAGYCGTRLNAGSHHRLRRTNHRTDSMLDIFRDYLGHGGWVSQVGFAMIGATIHGRIKLKILCHAELLLIQLHVQRCDWAQALRNRSGHGRIAVTREVEIDRC